MEGYYAVGLASLTFDIQVANVYYLTLFINQIRKGKIAILKSRACKQVKLDFLTTSASLGRKLKKSVFSNTCFPIHSKQW